MIHFIDFRETPRIIFIFDRKSVRFRDRPENTYGRFADPAFYFAKSSACILFRADFFFQNKPYFL